MRLINVRDSNVCNVLSNGRTLFCYRRDVPCCKHSYTFYQTNTIKISRMINWWKTKIPSTVCRTAVLVSLLFRTQKILRFTGSSRFHPNLKSINGLKKIKSENMAAVTPFASVPFSAGTQRFLIQNMCPAIEKYLVPYIDKNRQPIKWYSRTFFKSIVDWKSSFGRCKRIDCLFQAHRKRQVF